MDLITVQENICCCSIIKAERVDPFDKALFHRSHEQEAARLLHIYTNCLSSQGSLC